MTRTLVIGGCGFIGSHVVDQLRAEGHRLRVLDMRPEPFRPPVPDVEYFTGSFGCSDTIRAALEGVEVVVHLASTTVPATSNLDPVADIQGNLIATVQLLQIMRGTKAQRLVFMSSGGTIYGIPHSDPVPEDHPLMPISSYGVVKAAIEHYLQMEQKLHGLDYVVLRAANPYGPRQGHAGLQGVIGTYLWKIVRDEPIEIWGDGSVVRDFLDVRDLAQLVALAVRLPISGSFNAGSGTGRSVREIVDLCAELTGRELQPIYLPGRGFDVPRIVLDISRIRAATGWIPQTSLRNGMRDSWDWIRTQQEITVRVGGGTKARD